MNNILKQSIKYLKLCNASIRSEMARRIFYSLLPSADPIKASMTKGPIDIIALTQASSTRKNIIHYGAKSCLREMEHYKSIESNSANSILYKLMKDMYEAKNYKETLKYCIRYFSDENGWNRGFGGKKWQTISETLLKLVELDEELFYVKKRKDIDVVEEEIKILQEIIVYLNIFDGLAHNSTNVMENLVEEEARDIAGYYTQNKSPELVEKLAKYICSVRDVYDKTGYNRIYGDEALEFMKEKLNRDDIYFKSELIEYLSFEEIKKTKKIMDAKELEEPAHVFEEIEQTLKDSGEINQYKDYVRQLRSLPKYKSIESASELENNLKLISFRKFFKRQENYIKERLNKLNSVKDEYLLADIKHINSFKEYVATFKVLFELFSHIITSSYIKSDKAKEFLTHTNEFLTKYYTLLDLMEHSGEKRSESSMQEYKENILNYWNLCKEKITECLLILENI